MSHERHDLNGSLIRERPDTPAVYLIDLGKRRLIETSAIYHRVFGDDWSGVKVRPDLNEITESEPISAEACLIYAEGHPADMYLYDRGRKRKVLSPDAANKYHLYGRKEVRSRQDFERIPDGEPIA
jgi:hypothetical protein